MISTPLNSLIPSQGMPTLILSITWVLLAVGSADLIVGRHDVDEVTYVELGREYGATVGTFSGGCGTLVRPTWVVTAAHVADGDWFEDWMDIGGKRYTIERKIIHPDYLLQDGIRHDIALIELSEPVLDVEPARIYRGTDEVGKDIWFAGTGWAGTGLHGMVDEHINRDRIMRAAQNRVSGTGREYIEFVFDGPDSEDALPYEGISGPGDSGGPALLFEDGVPWLLGVSSHQLGQGEAGIQGVYGVREYYTRISDYLEWIDGHISTP